MEEFERKIDALLVSCAQSISENTLSVSQDQEFKTILKSASEAFNVNAIGRHLFQFDRFDRIRNLGYLSELNRDVKDLFIKYYQYQLLDISKEFIAQKEKHAMQKLEMETKNFVHPSRMALVPVKPSEVKIINPESDYSPRKTIDSEVSRGRSRARSRSRSISRKSPVRAKRESSYSPKRRSPFRRRSRSISPDSRLPSRRFRSRSPGRFRSRSPGRFRSRSPGRIKEKRILFRTSRGTVLPKEMFDYLTSIRPIIEAEDIFGDSFNDIAKINGNAERTANDFPHKISEKLREFYWEMKKILTENKISLFLNYDTLLMSPNDLDRYDQSDDRFNNIAYFNIRFVKEGKPFIVKFPINKISSYVAQNRYYQRCGWMLSTALGKGKKEIRSCLTNKVYYYCVSEDGEVFWRKNNDMMRKLTTEDMQHE